MTHATRGFLHNGTPVDDAGKEDKSAHGPTRFLFQIGYMTYLKLVQMLSVVTKVGLSDDDMTNRSALVAQNCS